MYCDQCVATVCAECIAKVESATRSALLTSKAKKATPFLCYRCAPATLGKFRLVPAAAAEKEAGGRGPGGGAGGGGGKAGVAK